MWRNICSELYNLISKKSFVLILLLLLISNVFLLLVSQNFDNSPDFISAQSKAELYSALNSFSDNNKRMEFINDKLDEVYSAEAELYTKNTYTERILLSKNLDYLKIISDYDSYVQGIIDSANKLTSISIFADENSFSYKSAVLTAEKYADILDVKPSYVVSEDVITATGFVFTDFVVVVLVFLVGSMVIGVERSIGITNLQKSFKCGRGRSVVSKIICTALLTFLVCVLFYGLNYIVSVAIYGASNVFSPIQSIRGFESCVLKISVMEYLIAFTFSKFGVMLLVSLFAMLISTLTKTRIGAYFVCGIIALLEAILTIFIGENNNLMSLKYLNIVSFVDTNSILSKCRNIDLFNYAVDYLILFITFSVTCVSMLVTANFLVYKYKRIEGYDKCTKSVVFTVGEPFAGTSVFLHELYKSLVSNKSGLIIIGLIILQLFININLPIKLYDSEKYELFYYSHYAGEFDDTKKSVMESDLQNLYYSGNEEDLMNFNKYVIPYYEYLCNQSQQGKNVSVMFYRGYNTLVGVDNNYSTIYTLLLNVLIIAITVSVFTREYEKKTTSLILSTKCGKKKLIIQKLGVVLVLVSIINICVYIPFVLRVNNCCSLSGANNPATSIPMFSWCSDSITVLQMIIVIFLFRFLTSIIIAVLVSVSAIVLKNTILSYVVSVVLFVVPVLLLLIDIDYLNTFFSLINIVDVYGGVS